MRALIALALVACSAPPKQPEVRPEPVAPTPKQREDAAVRGLLDDAVKSGQLHGVVVGIYRDRKQRYYGAGRVGGEQSKQPDADTLFEIGSISKLFTALLLAVAVDREELSLDQPVQSLVSKKVRIPDHQGMQITLGHLASHTSGLPRLPDNLASPPFDLDNPYAAYSRERLYEYLARAKLASPPGQRVVYSNLGAGLLGHVLALKAQTSYEDLLRERVLLPLGMNDTVIALDPARRARMAIGHDATGRAVPGWDFLVLAGLGAIRSTAKDMMRFLIANLTYGNEALAAAMRLTHVPRKSLGPGAGHIALGWHVRDHTFWHNGATGGFHSFCAFDTKRRVAVVVLASTQSPVVDRLGVRLLDPLPAGVDADRRSR